MCKRAAWLIVRKGQKSARQDRIDADGRVEMCVSGEGADVRTLTCIASLSRQLQKDWKAFTSPYHHVFGKQAASHRHLVLHPV